jgi:arylsulfatase A-like enzyme
LDNQSSSDDFFLWIHLFDPHLPLTPPQDLYRIFTRPTKEKKIKFIKFLVNEHHIDHDYYDYQDEKMLNKINSYDAEIVFADMEIEKFYKYYSSRGFNKKTLWIVMADHGEGLGNHNWYEHEKNLYDEQLRIPLLFHFSDEHILFQTRKVDKLTNILDIFPTLVNLLGNPPKELYGHISNFEGKTLLPFFKGLNIEWEKTIFAQRRTFNPKSKPKKIIPKQTKYEDGEKYCIRDEKYKYIYKSEGEDEFYDLEKDPFEMKNIVATSKKTAQEWKNHLLKEFKKIKEIQKPIKEVDKETIEKLKSLGYIE